MSFLQLPRDARAYAVSSAAIRPLRPRPAVLLSLALALVLAVSPRPVPAAEPPAASTTPAAPPAGDGAAFDVSRYAGKVVYLDFWASWCGPCVQSFPWMQSISDRYGPRGLSVVAINLDKSRAAADKFLARSPVRFDLYFDPQGRFAERYQVSGMPNSFLLDRQGRVIHRHVGFLPADQAALEARIQEALKDLP